MTEVLSEKWMIETLSLMRLREMIERTLFRWGIRRKNTWLTANDGIIWWGTRSYDFDNFDDEELDDDEFDHLIDDRIRFDSQWYKTMIWLFWWCSWCYHLLHEALKYDMCIKFASICYEYALYIYIIYVSSALVIDLRSIYDRSISRIEVMIDAMNTF